MDEAAAVAAFAELDIFSSFSDEQLRLLAFVCEEVSLAPGDILYSAGDAADGGYVLVSGALEATHSPVEGSKRFRIEPVALVGELGLMLTRPRGASLRAARTSTLLFVPRGAFLKLLRSHPELAEDVATTIRAELSRYLDSIAQLGGRFSS
ncbi:Cyclic nucleotide-binding domain-containing protein [Pelagibacterium halotolerans]|uniref:Putative transcriptional regulator, Crp/Fnr family n=2 Tax=Pelagibacterium TaxID=1082930 RepID=G4R7P5_PELHB|nr:putative transcriptional regulator, Crp/Fnr family [Pelagibacterium halotolerans B2]SEA63381.1 Cyclic nucleotide-binding domain-containing protein [Pelagibacterium halotolerans]